MRIAEFETVTPFISDASLPCRLEQRAPTAGPALLLVLLIPLTILLLAALAGMAGELAFNPSTRAGLIAHPGGALQIGVGLALLALLIAWPVRALVDRVGRRRVVVIDRDEVFVTDRGLLKERAWRRGLASYEGLAHHVRTTHAGVRHELILVHSTRRDSVLLALAPHIEEADVSALAKLLGVPIIPAAALYWRAPAALVQRIAGARQDGFMSAQA